MECPAITLSIPSRIRRHQSEPNNLIRDDFRGGVRWPDVNEMPPLTLTSAQVRHVAQLSRLALSNEEIEKYRHQLGAVIGYMNKLAELDLADIDAAGHTSMVNNCLADDLPGAGLPLDEVLRNAPAVMDRYFSVPKVLGEGAG